MSPDPVSWLVIESGWDVVGSDGGEIGKVDEIVGDDTCLVVARDARDAAALAEDLGSVLT